LKSKIQITLNFSGLAGLGVIHDDTRMIFGDAKESVSALVGEFKSS
jgi:NAD/NADP transhydrogenase beta subunit